METTILFVDDHPAYLDAYKLYITNNKAIKPFFTDNCDKAFEIIKNKKIKILFADLTFDNSTNKTNIRSGEELVKLVKNYDKDCKIAIATSYANMSKIQAILNSVNPDAYLVKTEIKEQDILMAIQNLLDDKIYYSPEVYRKQRLKAKLMIDAVGLQIASELPKHNSINNLVDAQIIRNKNGKLLQQRRIEGILSELRDRFNVITNLQLILKLSYLDIIKTPQF